MMHTFEKANQTSACSGASIFNLRKHGQTSTTLHNIQKCCKKSLTILKRVPTSSNVLQNDATEWPNVCIMLCATASVWPGLETWKKSYVIKFTYPPSRGSTTLIIYVAMLQITLCHRRWIIFSLSRKRKLRMFTVLLTCYMRWLLVNHYAAVHCMMSLLTVHCNSVSDANLLSNMNLVNTLFWAIVDKT